MAEQLLTLMIQILFPLALLKFTVWSMLIRPILNRTRRQHHDPQPRQRRRRRGAALPGRRQPPPPDALETGWQTQRPYAPSPRSDELQQAVGVLLGLYGHLGVNPADLAAGLHQVDRTSYLRALIRIRMTAEHMAHAGIHQPDGDIDLATTGYMLDVAERLTGLNQMQALQ